MRIGGGVEGRGISVGSRGLLSYNIDGTLITDTNTTYGATCGVASTSITNYVYDLNQRLAKVTMPSGAIPTYLYDAFGRQVDFRQELVQAKSSSRRRCTPIHPTTRAARA